VANKVNVSLRSALFLGAATAAALSVTAAGFGQTAETVVVTGTRIQQQNVISSSPVTSVGQAELKFEGATNVESLLNNLPATVADFTNQASNGATGQATVNLRGLGSSRTLVLVDGRRLMPSDPANPVADLNQIPAALVDHIDVLTGGASAVYGSDAEAGVVNFIMRKDFEGIEFNGQISIQQLNNSDKRWTGIQDLAGYPKAPENYWGGRTLDSTVIFGVNTPDGKGNITGYLGYRTISPVTQANTDYAACSVAVKAAGLRCFGSGNSNHWMSFDNYFAGADYNFFETGSGAKGTGSFVDWTGSTAQRYNYGATNYIQRPDQRYIGGFNGHYQAASWAEVYTSFMFSDDHTEAQIAPSGLFLGTGRFALPTAPTGSPPAYNEVNCDNPLMTAQENALLCGQTPGSNLITSGAIVNALGHAYWDGAGNLYPGQSLNYIGRRNIEGGPRVDDMRHTAYRFVLGTKGEIGSGWAYDIAGQYGITLYNENYRNEFSVQRVQNALQVDPVTGNCKAYDLGIDTNCVPLDIFNGYQSLTPDQLAYVTGQGFKSGYTEEYLVSGSISGDLGQYGIKSPFAQTGVGTAFGFEYRKEIMQLDSSRDFQLNDLYGQGGATLPVPRSAFSVIEGYGELEVPLIQGKQFAEDVSVNGGFRYSSYSTAGTTWTYKASLQWTPIEDVRFRSSYEHAVRAPNVLELYAPANVVLFQGADPCASPGSSTVLANCLAQHVGVGPVLTAPSAQYNQQTQGNLALKPEEANTYSVGMILTPSFLPGFNLSLDYYSIKVAHYINSVNPNTTLAGCYGETANEATKAITCPMVRRAAGGSGPVYGAGFVSAQTINTGFLRTSGIDVEANYMTGLEDFGLPEGWGAISANFVGTYMNELVTNPLPGLGEYDCAGKFGVTCTQPAPQWRHKLRVTWDTPWSAQFSILWRHLSSAALDLNSSNPLLNSACGSSGLPCPDVVDGHLPAFDYFDIATSWEVSKGLELRAGVNNIFGKNPPVVDANSYSVSGPPYGNGNTFPGVYDSLGRTLYMSITAKL
jgi:outer membrane receptor protein involved in Fe transport